MEKIFSGGVMEKGVPLLRQIEERMSDMSDVQRNIGRFILENPEEAFRISITKLAHRSGAKSESTVVRFYRLLGFESYNDFKVTLATQIAGNTFYFTNEQITRDDSVGEVKLKMFNGAIAALRTNVSAIPDSVLEETVSLLDGARRVYFIGFAASGAVAQDAYFRFSRLGLNCYFSPDPHLTAVVLAEPQEGDVIIGISQSGESKDVVIPIKRARPPARVVAITTQVDSPLGNTADIIIATTTEELNYRTDAMITHLVQQITLGTLFTSLSLRRGEAALSRLEKTKQALSYLKY